MNNKDNFRFYLKYLEKAGYTVESHSPGDGKTRYILVHKADPVGREFGRALGRKEAVVMMSAFLAGSEEGSR